MQLRWYRIHLTTAMVMMGLAVGEVCGLCHQWGKDRGRHVYTNFGEFLLIWVPISLFLLLLVTAAIEGFFRAFEVRKRRWYQVHALTGALLVVLFLGFLLVNVTPISGQFRSWVNHSDFIYARVYGWPGIAVRVALDPALVPPDISYGAIAGNVILFAIIASLVDTLCEWIVWLIRGRPPVDT